MLYADLLEYDTYNYKTALNEYRLAKEYLKRARRQRRKDRLYAKAVSKQYDDHYHY